METTRWQKRKPSPGFICQDSGGGQPERQCRRRGSLELSGLGEDHTRDNTCYDATSPGAPATTSPPLGKPTTTHATINRCGEAEVNPAKGEGNGHPILDPRHQATRSHSAGQRYPHPGNEAPLGQPMTPGCAGLADGSLPTAEHATTTCRHNVPVAMATMLLTKTNPLR
ncbi:hypothetical protein E2C01_031922 [Portunus trituberculatus]|uniref:Uncharacterized protein n=1 Tax=Portunus trituberculatus TaxID=210409 RepID=A0A5B7EZ64_PORTR|nr:hypothetical protein [Portunus trituberculatus]